MSACSSTDRSTVNLTVLERAPWFERGQVDRATRTASAPTRFIAWLLCAIALLFASPRAHAAAPSITQTIPLYAGWNLISLQVGDGPITVANFRAALSDPARLIEIWGYAPGADPNRIGTWQTYQPQLATFTSDLLQLLPGKGYWVNVSQAATITLTGPAWSGDLTLAAGWNLVGFGVPKLATNESQDLSSIFGATFDRVTQAWTFDPTTQRFIGYDLTAIPAVRTLTGVNPGIGYWVYALQPITLTAQPYVALPQDADQSPLQSEQLFSATDPRWLGSNPAAYVGQQVRFRGTEDAALDLNNNGLLDSPFTQDTVVFDAGVDVQVISIGNFGSGVFPWSIAKDGSIPWLKFDDGTLSSTAKFADLLETASGVVSSDRDSIVLRVDRTRLQPGQYTGSTFTIQAGALTRTIKLILVVPNSGGDWKGYATVQRVNGKNIALGKVDLALSVFMASTAYTETSFRAILNRDRSLLFPKDVFMNGIFYAGNQFSLTTNFVMPAGDRNAPPYDTFQHDPNNPAGDRDVNGNGKLDVANPFPMQITRGVTLLGERKSPDLLEGSYVEAIGGLLPNGQVVFMEGTFTLSRESAEPTKRSVFNSSDTPMIAPTIGGSSGSGFIERVITVVDPVTLQGVTATITASFPRPAALTITLRSPQGTLATLHRGGTTLASPAKYTLADFNNQNGAGAWTLRIQWDPATTPERGSFSGWTLNLEGLATYSVAGKIVDSSNAAIAGATVILSGSNLIAQTSSSATGAYAFADLTENNYTVSVSRPGYVSAVKSVIVSDKNITGLDIQLQAVPVTDLALSASPNVGAAPFNTTFLLQVPLASVGTNPSAVWTFGDGSAAIASTASTTDDITATTATHLYTKAGTYTAQVAFTTTLGTSTTTVTRTTQVQVQRSAPDAAGAAYQISNVSFVGSVGASSLATANPPIQTGAVTTVSVTLAGGATIPNVKSAVVYQESKRDGAGFDIDRYPAGTGQFRPNAEDTDFNNNGVFDTYTPPTIGGQPIPEAWRMVVTMGGYVFGEAPSVVGNFRLQAGSVEP